MQLIVDIKFSLQSPTVQDGTGFNIALCINNSGNN